MKILHVITRSEWGGAQKVVYLLATKQREKEHQVTVLCGEKGRLVDELQKAGIRVRFNPYLLRHLSWRDVQAFFLIMKEVREGGYDLLHAHSSKAGILTRLVGKFLRIPVCFTVHGFGISPRHSRMKQFLYHGIERFWARYTDCLVFVSPGNLQVAQENGWLTHCRTYTVIPNGIEISQDDRDLFSYPWDLQRREARRHLGIPEKAFVVGNLARVAWIKNPDFWLQVAQRFTESFPDSYFIWFGGGDDFPSYRGSCGERIRFAGEISEIDSALLSMDLFFLSSHSEGMPLAVLESMARGVPVLAPDLLGLKDLLGDGGQVYPPDDLESVLFHLDRLRSPEIRRKLGEQGQKRCVETFSVERMVENYEAVYQLLIATKTSKR